MADNDSDMLKEFQEFLDAKRSKEQEDAEKEDFEVEIWDEKGRGVRTRRSHAKSFLQQLGLDLDPEPNSDDKGDTDNGGSKDDPKGSRRTNSRTGNAPSSTSLPRKYFAPKTK